MPDLADRLEHEARIASGLSRIFSDAQQQFDAGQSVDWQDFHGRVQQTLTNEEEIVFALVMLLMLDEFANRGGVASAAATAWTRQRTREVAERITQRARQELAAGRIIPNTAAETIAATEITATVSSAETAARRANVEQRRAGGDRPPIARPAVGRQAISPLAIEDGLTAIWRTEQDARVCPICRPLDGQRQEAWDRVFPTGPPAHPRCRCYLDYVEATA